ncbi:MAG: response regulator [Oceanobacter sp.]
MSEHRILVVEDDAKLSAQIERFLTGYQYQVEVVHDGSEAIQRIQQDPPDLVVLDLMLPGADGFEVCRSVRAGFKGSILMLTASEDDMDHVAGIELGADDFLIKPIHPRVLLAHVRLLLRRQSAEANPTSASEISTNSSSSESSTTPADNTRVSKNSPLIFGSLTIHPLQRLVSLEGEDITLTPAEFDVLLLLARHAEEVVSRDDMLKTLRGIEYDGFDRSIDVKVSALRKKLGDNTSQPRRLITVRAKGYLFVPDAW